MKTLAAQSKQGAREFLTEINTISNVKHPNLVELIGCCIQGANRILVYEYVENKSLDKVLLGTNGLKFLFECWPSPGHNLFSLYTKNIAENLTIIF